MREERRQLQPSLVFVLQVGRCQIRYTSANLHVSRACVRLQVHGDPYVLNRGAPGRRNVDEPVCDRSTSGMQVLGSKSVHLLHHIARCVLGPVCVQPGVSRKIESHEAGPEIIKVCPPSERNDRVPRSSVG